MANFIYKTKKLSVIFTLFLLLGCNEDFLEVEPKDKFFTSNYYQTENQVYLALIAAYNPLQWTYVDGFWTSSVMLGEIASDNANAGGDPTNNDQPGWQQIDDFEVTSQTNEVTSFWRKYYYGIGRANLVINAQLESNIVEKYIAEAKFLRAFYLFELVRTFGPVPIITNVENGLNPNNPRKSLSEVYGQITKDLEEAIPYLEQSFGANMAGRVTKGAAQALLGKAYLYWGDLLDDNKEYFQKSASSLRDVIESNQYALLDDYNDLFAYGAGNTEESVFEIQHSNLVPASWNDPYDFINGNMIVQLCGIRGLCSNHPEYLEGWGFMLITKDLYDSYLPDDQYRRDATIISRTSLTRQGCTVIDAVQNMYDLEGFWQKKYANYKSYTTPNGGEISLLKDANQPYIRYADVLLMYAEALQRSGGNESEALEYVDMVRERAAGPGDNTAIFTDAATLMANQGWSFMDLIWYERRVELAGEGDRWYDLVRSGRATKSLFESANDKRAANFDKNDVYLPIPQSEIEKSSGTLTAYPDQSLFQ